MLGTVMAEANTILKSIKPLRFQLVKWRDKAYFMGSHEGSMNLKHLSEVPNTYIVQIENRF